MSFITPPSYPGFSTAAYTTSPNNAVNVAGVIAVGGTTDVDLALLPKALGAILADVPDNGNAGGIKRGSNAVDLQIARSASTQVASGARAFIGAGQSNSAAGQDATCVGGATNLSTGQQASIGGGGGNQAGASGSDSAPTVAGGSGNYASGTCATVPGGNGAFTRGTYGRLSYGSYNTVAKSGQWQFSKLVETAVTTTAAPFAVSVQGAGGGARAAGTVLVVADKSANYFETIVVARDSATGNSSAWRITGLIKRGTGVGTTAIVGAPTVSLIAQDAGAAAWAVAVSADTTLGALQVTVTGAAGSTIRWNAHTELTEVTF